MSGHSLTAFERRVVAGLAYRAGLAAALLDAWADLPEGSLQCVRTLVDEAQLGLTEQGATKELLDRAAALGLLDATPTGYRPSAGAHALFNRLAFAPGAVDFYVREVHRDATSARIVLTKPPGPSLLEQKLSELGWKTADLESTDHAFNDMVRSARRRVIVMTPFFDNRGAAWLKELFSYAIAGVERLLVLRSLDDPTRVDGDGIAFAANWPRSRGTVCGLVV